VWGRSLARKRGAGGIYRFVGGAEASGATGSGPERGLSSERSGAKYYAQIFDSAPDLIAVVDRNHRFLDANRAYYMAHGLSLRMVRSHTLAEVLGEELYQQVVRASLERAFAGEPVTYEHWFDYAAIGRRYMEVRYFPLTSEGRTEAIAVVLRDLTAWKQADIERERLLTELKSVNEQLLLTSMRNKELAESAGRRAAEWDATLTSIAEGMVIFDREGRVVRMNPAAERMTGVVGLSDRDITLDELAKVLCMETADGEKLSTEELPPARALRGEVVSGQIMVAHPTATGLTWLSVSSAPIRTPSGGIGGAVTTFADITWMHDLQEQREDLVRAVSHDLRNPLTAIQGQAQLLQKMLDRAGQDGVFRQSVESIVTGCRRMNAMIQDLVDLARLESGQLRLERRQLALRPFVMEMLMRSATAVNPKRVRVEIPEELPLLNVDPNRLERILLNLLSNALKYSAPGTTVRLAAFANGNVTVTVEDQGTGISPEDLPHLFQRFYRAGKTRRMEGLGMGLYITRMLVEAHGGRIWVESQPEAGSRFSFTLPPGDEQAGLRRAA
jgi:PAS domain S-box-containing protein